METTARDTEIQSAFQRRMADAEKRSGGTLGIMVRDLGSDLELTWNANVAFPTASTMKVPLLYALYRLADSGDVDLSQRVTLRPEDRVPGSGVLQHMDAGMQPTIRDLAELMIIVSDNYATDLIYGIVGRERLATTLRELALADTHLPHTVWQLLSHMIGVDGSDRSITYEEFRSRLKASDGTGPIDPYTDDEYDRSTPADMVRMMEAIASGTGVSDTSRDGMLAILKHQNFNDRIPGRFPEDPSIEVAHKTGSVRGVRNDVGIVYTPHGAYAIAMMSRNLPDPTAGVQELARISRWVLDTMMDRFA